MNPTNVATRPGFFLSLSQGFSRFLSQILGRKKVAPPRRAETAQEPVAPLNRSAIVITPDFLRSFLPLKDLTEEQLHALVESSTVEEFLAGDQVIKLGSDAPWLFYLLDGRLELEAKDGGRKVLVGGTAATAKPIARLKPCQYSVTTLSQARLLRIETSQLEEFLAHQKQESARIEPTLTNENLESRLYYDLFKDIQEDTLILPSLPEVAVRIRSLLDKEDVSANQIASVVRIDSGIAAKLVKVANSALYGGVMPVESLSQAIVRLGMRTTSDLVFYFTFSNLFRTKSNFLREKMKSLWQHSAHVAATSYVLAKNVSGFDPERALLMGLLHDVGAVAILNYADKYPEVTDNPEIIEGVISQLRGKVGGMILCKWHFQEDFITTALEAEKWYRNPSPRPDYCDLVMIAQLHSFIDAPGMVDVPPMNQLPAFSKLALGQLTPQLGLKMLDAAKEEIDEIMKILAM